MDAARSIDLKADRYLRKADPYTTRTVLRTSRYEPHCRKALGRRKYSTFALNSRGVAREVPTVGVLPGRCFVSFKTCDDVHSLEDIHVYFLFSLLKSFRHCI